MDTDQDVFSLKIYQALQLCAAVTWAGKMFCVNVSLNTLKGSVLLSFSVVVDELSLSTFVRVKQHSDLAGWFPWTSGG